MKKLEKQFISALKALCEEYELCVVPEENDKYELPLTIAPYRGVNKSLYDDLSDVEADKEFLDKFLSKKLEIVGTKMVWDAKSKKMVEAGIIEWV